MLLCVGNRYTYFKVKRFQTSISLYILHFIVFFFFINDWQDISMAAENEWTLDTVTLCWNVKGPFGLHSMVKQQPVGQTKVHQCSGDHNQTATCLTTISGPVIACVVIVCFMKLNRVHCESRWQEFVTGFLPVAIFNTYDMHVHVLVQPNVSLRCRSRFVWMYPPTPQTHTQVCSIKPKFGGLTCWVDRCPAVDACWAPESLIWVSVGLGQCGGCCHGSGSIVCVHPSASAL